MEQKPLIRNPALDIMSKNKTVYDVPIDQVTHYTVKLGLLGCLAWDYADTVINIASQLHISQTKKAARAIRELKRSYDQFWSRQLDSKDLQVLMSLAVLFEDINSKNFYRLCQGLNAEISRSGLTGMWLTLVQSVQMAMTMIDAMTIYADEFNLWLDRRGVAGGSALMPHFKGLAILLPEFAGEFYDPDSPSRKLTAKILVNDLKQIELYDDNGKV